MIANVGNFAAPIDMQRRIDERNRLLALMQQQPQAAPVEARNNALAAYGGPTRDAAAALSRSSGMRQGDKLHGVDNRLADLFKELPNRGAPAFGISEGLRDAERQRELVAAGKSQTMNSRHLDGNAVDIHLLTADGKADWTFERYRDFWENHVNPLAQEMGVPIEWGGNWKTLKDGVHFQLAR